MADAYANGFGVLDMAGWTRHTLRRSAQSQSRHWLLGSRGCVGAVCLVVGPEPPMKGVRGAWILAGKNLSVCLSVCLSV